MRTVGCSGGRIYWEFALEQFLCLCVGVLIGGGYDKGGSFDEWTQLFPGRVKHLVLIGVTAPQVRASAEKFGFTAISDCETFKEAVDLCREKAEDGDCVLLSPACASWGMFDNYEQRGDMFKEQVRGYLK